LDSSVFLKTESERNFGFTHIPTAKHVRKSTQEQEDTQLVYAF